MEQMRNATSLSILTASQLMAAELPPRSDLLPPWLASDTAALVYGPAGIGKSFLALGVAWAVASGDSFLGRRSRLCDGAAQAVRIGAGNRLRQCPLRDPFRENPAARPADAAARFADAGRAADGGRHRHLALGRGGGARRAPRGAGQARAQPT